MSDVEPVEIDLRDSERTFRVVWSDGSETRVPYRALRLACACATCVDELTGAKRLDPATVSPEIGVRDVEQVGLYGVRIVWTDQHRTGIYTFDRLRSLT